MMPEDKDELIGKYLAGEANNAERLQVEEWVRERPENQRYFGHLKTIFDQASTIQERHRFDADAAWNALRNKLKDSGDGQVESHGKDERVLGPMLYWRIAASVLLIMGVGYLINRSLYTEPVQSSAIRTAEHTQQDTLPDGTAAFLNRNTSIAYEHRKAEQKRRIVLEGEAFFDVMHLEEQPLVVESRDVYIEDIGTSFNVKAYPDSDTVEVYVQSGEVAFYAAGANGLRLAAGETGIYDRRSNTFSRLARPDTNVLAYKTRIFTFVDQDLGSVVKSLNAVYETKIKLADDKLKSCRLNVTFRSESIDVIADIIAETLSLHLVVENEEIRLEGAGCEE